MQQWDNGDRGQSDNGTMDTRTMDSGTTGQKTMGQRTMRLWGTLALDNGALRHLDRAGGQ
jgi:hypothetical protein